MGLDVPEVNGFLLLSGRLLKRLFLMQEALSLYCTTLYGYMRSRCLFILLHSYLHTSTTADKHHPPTANQPAGLGRHKSQGSSSILMTQLSTTGRATSTEWTLRKLLPIRGLSSPPFGMIWRRDREFPLRVENVGAERAGLLHTSRLLGGYLASRVTPHYRTRTIALAKIEP